MDFKGKTNSAVAKPPTSGSVAGIYSGISELFSSIVASFSDFLVETVDLEVSRSMQPKCSSRMSNKEVSVPARAILILPKPSSLN